MELNDKNPNILEVSESQPRIVEYFSATCLDNGIISNGSAAATLTTVDGTTLPITLIVAEAPSSQNELDSVLTNGSEMTDKSLNVVSCMPDTQYVTENVKSAPHTLYINLPEKTSKKSVGISDVTNKLDKYSDEESVVTGTTEASLENTCSSNSNKHQADLHTLETTTRLEEFMDIVTTYKCKFCRFSCPWKSGLMSHIRNCHFEASRKASISETDVHNYALAPKNNLEKRPKIAQVLDHGYSQQSDEVCGDEDELAESDSCSPDLQITTDHPPPIEKHVFLCGQCSEGFSSFDSCKQHMIKDHKLNLAETSSKKDCSTAAKKGRGRPRGRPYSSKISNYSCSKAENSNELVDEGGSDNQESVQKRTSRTPKNLEEDYYLECKRKRIRKENLNDKPFRCIVKGCGYRFSTASHLHYHSTCHSASEKPFICPECNEYADHWRSVAMHLWKEHTVDIDLYTCEECGYKTYSHFKLDNHKKIHSDERSFICTTCEKGFKQLSQLRNHIVIHTDRKNMPEKRWYSEQKCEICNRTFSDSKCLRKHQQAVHSKLKPFVCTYCGHMSARKAMLQLHMRQHTGEKPFLCDHCEYRTGDHNSLRRHRMRHTGIKPYKCPHCPYACIQAISYKTHLKNKHPGLEGLYACSFCAFRSVSKENYINHMSDHRRGVLPGATDVHSENTENVSQESTEMHLPENTLQQLEGILPGNITAAQLIYSCLNALSQEGGTINLPPGVTTASACDGTQTITIQLPATQELENEQYYLTIQQQDESSTALETPATNEQGNNEKLNVEMEILQPVTVIQEDASDSQSLDSSAFIDTANEQPAKVEVTSSEVSEVKQIT